MGTSEKNLSTPVNLNYVQVTIGFDNGREKISVVNKIPDGKIRHSNLVSLNLQNSNYFEAGTGTEINNGYLLDNKPSNKHFFATKTISGDDNSKMMFITDQYSGQSASRSKNKINPQDPKVQQTVETYYDLYNNNEVVGNITYSLDKSGKQTGTVLYSIYIFPSDTSGEPAYKVMFTTDGKGNFTSKFGDKPYLVSPVDYTERLAKALEGRQVFQEAKDYFYKLHNIKPIEGPIPLIDDKEKRSGSLNLEILNEGLKLLDSIQSNSQDNNTNLPFNVKNSKLYVG